MSLAISPSKRIASSPNYKWWAYGAIAIGMFLTVMDQTGINIALPEIADHFEVDIPTVQWISLGYVLSTSATLLPMGRLSDMIGRKPVYLIGFVIFITFGILGGSSPMFALLVTFKVIQGIGSAAIQANGMAMITEAFSDRERGKAMGLYMAIIGTGSISGPIVGGLLVSSLGWRAIFFAGVPVGLMALLSASIVLVGRTRSQNVQSRNMKFDWAGASLSSGALVSFLLAITNAHRVGWTSPAIVVGFVLAFLLAVAFLWWQPRAANPMLELNFFRSRAFSIGVSARFISFLGGTSVFFLMPFYLVQGLGFSASKAGLLMVPGSITMAIIGPFSGLLSDRVGARVPTVIGMALSASSMIVFSQLRVDSPEYHIIIGMLLSGAGMGMFSSANTSAILGSVDKEKYGVVTAFVNLTRTSANVTGIAIATTIVTLTMSSLGHEPNLSAVADGANDAVKVAFVTGLNRSFMVSAGLMLIAFVLSALRPGRREVTSLSSKSARTTNSASATSDD